MLKRLELVSFRDKVEGSIIIKVSELRLKNCFLPLAPALLELWDNPWKKKVGDQLKTKECLELTATGNCWGRQTRKTNKQNRHHQKKKANSSVKDSRITGLKVNAKTARQMCSCICYDSSEVRDWEYEGNGCKNWSCSCLSLKAKQREVLILLWVTEYWADWLAALTEKGY